MHENKARLKIGGINTFPEYRNVYLIPKDMLQICIQNVPVFVCEEVNGEVRSIPQIKSLNTTVVVEP